jgi:peptidoglycan pentaglycine glycine transferase (the first glycine)
MNKSNMNWKIYNSDSIKKYTDFINSMEYSGIWHSPDWLEFQKSSKKIQDGFLFGIEENNEIILAGIFLIYKSKNFNYGYIPAGFLYKKIDRTIYKFLISNLKVSSKSYNLTFFQADSIIPFSDSFENILKISDKHKLNQKLPIPQFTNIIPLDLTLDEILNQMKPKGRYNIKLAEKKGVEVRVADEKDIPLFYKMLSETASRDGFRTNSEEYYKLMLNKLKDSIFLAAFHEDEMIAGGIFTYMKYQGLYYYGASSNNKRNLMAPYLIQWEAIKIAKEKGCTYFDFMGIADPGNPNDRLSGVTDFKLKFGGKIVKFQTSYHVIVNSVLYFVFKVSKFLKKLI